MDVSIAWTHDHANSVFRHVDLIAGAEARQRAVSDGLLLGTLLEQDLASDIEVVGRDAVYLADTRLDLAMSLDEDVTRDTFYPDEMALVGALRAMTLDNARLYREAEAQRHAAELANQSKSQFLRNMSHELRTPLNAIAGFVDLLEMGVSGPVTDNQRVALARVRANQRHLLVLVSELQNLMRVETVRMEYRSTGVSMRQALADVAGMLSAPIADKGLILDGPHGNADAIAWADPDRVRQILVNLVMNAVKYTPPNRGIISLSCAVEGDRVLARVADTGPGIPRDALESIFEPFVQLPAGFADRRGGVGLGLAISRDLARAMEGDLRLESTIGVGSQFTLALPPPPKELTRQCQ